MLTAPPAGRISLILLASIAIGSLLGSLSGDAGTLLGGLTDPVLLVLVGVMFFTLRLDALPALRRTSGTVALALSVNFLLIPVVALALSRIVPDDALRLGVLIYCLFPCTDWFLGFTRLAGGDTVTGAALIPVQMTLQLALYPVWLSVLTETSVGSTISVAGPTLLTWFVLPAGAALALRVLLRVVLPRKHRLVTETADRAVPWATGALIMCLFAGNVEAIGHNPVAFAWVLLVVFLFFVAVYLVGEAVARALRLPYSAHALLTMTTSARNAPLMLVLTGIALPGEPVVAAAIVVGMLIEFPHLTAVTHLLRRQSPPSQAQPQPIRTRVTSA